MKNNSFSGVKEEETEYRLETEEKLYDEKKIREIGKKHDKMFRNILGRKKEVAKFLNQFLELEEIIKEENIIQCPTDFITRKYEERHSDIIYRLNDKPVYFLIEHQSTVDKNMPLRIWEYIGEIVRKERIMPSDGLLKEEIYPIIIPIVIYTGYQNWNAKINFGQKQYQEMAYKKYEFNVEYNLIAVQNYTFEELLEKRSLFGSIMIMEKCRTKEELVTYGNKIIETMGNMGDEMLAEIIVHMMLLQVGEKTTRKIIEKIKEREVSLMSPLTKMLLDLEIKERNAGRLEILKEAVKNMLQFGETEEKIEKYMGISKEELENIKGMLAD